MSGRPVDLRPSGVRRTTGLPRVGTGAVQRLRATARDAVARLTAPRAGRCRHGRGAGRPHPPSTRSLTVLWRRVPESVGEAAGRKDPHLAGTGATVDAGARPPGPVPRGSRTRPEGTWWNDHHGSPRRDVGDGHDVHGDGRRGGDLRLRGRRSANAPWPGSRPRGRADATAAGRSRCRKCRCGWPRPRWRTATRRCPRSAANSGSPP